MRATGRVHARRISVRSSDKSRIPNLPRRFPEKLTFPRPAHRPILPKAPAARFRVTYLQWRNSNGKRKICNHRSSGNRLRSS